MIIFRLPTFQIQNHKFLLWGVEKTWSQNGRWDYTPIIWNFEKALQESLFDKDSTKMIPKGSNSRFSGDLLSSIKKSTFSLKKLHSRNVELYTLLFTVNAENKLVVEGICPPWTKVLVFDDLSKNVNSLSPTHNQWFSVEASGKTNVYIQRHDLIGLNVLFETQDQGQCRYEPFSEWITSKNPIAYGLSSRSRIT